MREPIAPVSYFLRRKVRQHEGVTQEREGTNQVALVTRGILSSSGIASSSTGTTESSPASSYHSAYRQYAHHKRRSGRNSPSA